jgi:hypothetical protein
MTWHRTSSRSVASGPYAVSRSTVLDATTGGLVDRYSAWHGLDLAEQPRGAPCQPAELLGIRGSAAEAKALCEAHRGRSPLPQGQAA